MANEVGSIRNQSRAALMVVLLAVLTGCGAAGSGVASIEKVGELAFFDPSLSASGQLACASCHAPETGHAALNNLAAQLGGVYMNVQGLRNSQPLRYLRLNQAFRIDVDGTPVGGFFWDGRANSLEEQAAGPLLGAREMANADKAAVVLKISQSAWARQFKAVFGEKILEDVDLAFDRLTDALAQYQRGDLIFNGYSSKYDAFLRGQTALSDAETRGLALFNDPDKGNCASCHPSDKQADGSHPLFTDFTYDNLGVPRNLEIVRNSDANYFDLGLCGRADLASQTQWCGAFKVPSLRNVALRKAYFHNGKFKYLTDVVSFYVQRDTQPEKWYSRNSDGSVNKFDDLPQAYKGNVNTTEAPYNRSTRQLAALTDSEIQDVIAFLSTLTDGWHP